MKGCRPCPSCGEQVAVRSLHCRNCMHGLGLYIEAFWRRVEKTDGCWIWRGGVGANYGVTYDHLGNRVGAHRYAYEVSVGPIPDGLHLDHLCRNTLCVNPAHLEAVTRQENRRRQQRAVTSCKHGHLFNEENTYVDKRGHRSCKACKSQRSKLAYDREAHTIWARGYRERKRQAA